MPEHTYVVDTKKGAATLYGPFPDLLTAEIAKIQAMPFEDVEKWKKAHGNRQERAHPGGTGDYDDDEIAHMLREPGAFNYRKVLVKPPGALKMHASWGAWVKSGEDIGWTAHDWALHFLTDFDIQKDGHRRAGRVLARFLCR